MDPVLFLVYGTHQYHRLERRKDSYIVQDRTNIGNAKVAGMDVDVGLSSTQYFLAIVIFQVSYVIAEVPSKHATLTLAQSSQKD